MKEQTHSGRLFFLVVALILVAFLPLVVVMSQQQQTYRSKAAEIIPFNNNINVPNIPIITPSPMPKSLLYLMTQINFQADLINMQWL
ncbi:MAG TPA: hypothetical protein VJH96_00665 [Patescibacteria group bacterium]|nr:hypothetical protein [Patescibacteria group bacterium]